MCKDVVALMDIVNVVPGADSTRVGMWGASRGVMQSYLAIKQLPEIKALVAIAGNTDLAKSLLVRPDMDKVHQNLIPDYASNKSAALAQRSAINFVEQLNPDLAVLMLHGSEE